MKVDPTVTRNQKRTLTKNKLTFVEVLSLITFVAGFWYLWASNVIPLYAKTSAFTIIGGIFAFAIGQIIQKGYIEPVQELQKTIGEVGSTLLVYANTYDSIIDEELKKEATRKFRQLSGELYGKRRVTPNYGMCERLEILPPKQDVSGAITNLILLANCVGSDKYETFCKASDCIKQLLWLDT